MFSRGLSESSTSSSAVLAALLAGAAAGTAAAAAVTLVQREVPRNTTKSQVYLGAEERILKQLRSARIIPVVSLNNASSAAAVAAALVDGGLPVVEVVFRSEAAEDALRAMAVGEPRAILGAGTILSAAMASRAVAAGAQFIVSPGLNPEVVDWCRGKGVPVIPGVATPSEIEAAMRLGLTTLKFFPAEANGGVAALKAISAPYPSLTFMPTGGISVELLKSYLSLKQVVAVGGSWMIPEDLLSTGNMGGIKDLAQKAANAAQAI